MLTVLRLIIKGITDLRHNKWEHILTLCAITLVSFLGLLFFLLLHNIQSKVIESNNQAAFTVYWKQNADSELLEKQWKKIQNMPELASLVTYTPDQAASIMQKSLGKDLDFDFDQLNTELPPTAVLTFEFPPDNLKKEAEKKYKSLQDLKMVQNVNYDKKEVSKSSAWLREIRKIIWPLILFLIFLIGLIVGNTFKISQISKREEIEVLKLIGAGNWYIRLPLFSGAAMQALVGGGIALGLLKAAQVSLNNILSSSPLWIELQFLGHNQIVAVLMGLIGVSIISSWVAIKY